VSSLQERLRRLAGGRSASAAGREGANSVEGGTPGGGALDGGAGGSSDAGRGAFRSGTDQALRHDSRAGEREDFRGESPSGLDWKEAGETSVGHPETGRSAAGGPSLLDGSPDDGGSGLPSSGRLVETGDGQFIVRERRYPLGHLHGRYALGDLAGRHGRLNRVSRRFAGIKPVASVRDLLFFDTETTGLGVGAGNVPFMIGLGFFEEREFVVQQLFVRDPGEEMAMLGHLRQLVERFTHLVTYNGKSFDWPVLANRFVLHRIPFAGSRLEHLDLLYISRNLWRNSLESCRLSRVEEERLGIVREDDVPGYLAPVLYFQYLSDGDIAQMESVFRHNETDVLTLVTLAAHLGAVLNGDADWDRMEAEDLYRTGLWLLDAELPDLAERPFAALLDRPEESAGYAARLATAYKRMRRYDKAVPLWEQAAGLVPPGAWLPVTEQSLEPFVELAIYHEHHSRQPDKALRWTEEALNRVERLLSLHARVHGNADKARRWKAELDRRRMRLLGKLRKEAGTSAARSSTDHPAESVPKSSSSDGAAAPASSGSGRSGGQTGEGRGHVSPEDEVFQQQFQLD